MNRILIKKIMLMSALVLVLIALLILIHIITRELPIKRKLIGTWNIEMENSYWARTHEYEIGTIIYVEIHDIIKLPTVFENNIIMGDNISDEQIEKNKYAIEERRQNAKGIWEIISTNPDTVFFNVPKNPLHGKYAVRFFIDENGYGSMGNNIYKMELTNDSTYLICNKGDFVY
jgi:hypothetical protein